MGKKWIQIIVAGKKGVWCWYFPCGIEKKKSDTVFRNNYQECSLLPLWSTWGYSNPKPDMG